MDITIVVVDGMGGGLGAQLVSRARQRFGAEAKILALGTNSAATERMLKAGADRGASGENAIRVSIGMGDIILGPIGIAVPDSLMGEITASMAQAVVAARGRRILVPVGHPHFALAGLDNRPVGKLVDEALELAAQAASDRLTS